VHLYKIDISDGFYHNWLRLEDIPKLGIAFSTEVNSKLWWPCHWYSGWGGSVHHRTSCAVMETIANVANEHIMQGNKPPLHCLDTVAKGPKEAMEDSN